MPVLMSAVEKKPYLIVLVATIIVNVAGIGIRYFTDDPSLYSILGRNMAQSNNFTDLIYHGTDWLDKPHFPFWATAVSFKVFGIHTIAYKFPALLFFFIGVAYTYKMAKKFYDTETALIAILILLTGQHVVMSNTDVRAEPYIIGLLTGAIYHFYKLKEKFSWADLLIGSLFTACAVMTKGIYLLIPIGGAIIGDYVFKKDIKSLFNLKWLLASVCIAVFTLPEIYTLYMQFDLHPEKVVFGKTGISGIHWFLWESQFGRFNNDSFIRNTHGSVFFFIHTLLWAFAPWAFILYYAIFRVIRNMVKGVVMPEYLTISGAMVMLFIFSISKFQLPFYTNILFPFFAIITAVYIRHIIDNKRNRFFNITQSVVATLLIVLILVLSFVFAPEHWLLTLTLFALLAFIAWYLLKNNMTAVRSIFLFTCCVSVFVNAYLVTVVYPVLVDYKGDVLAAEYINRYYSTSAVISAFNVPNAFEFYTDKPVTFMDLAKATKKSHAVILINQEQKDILEKDHADFTLLKAIDNYPNENLKLPFIIKSKRPTALNRFFLIRMGSSSK